MKELFCRSLESRHPPRQAPRDQRRKSADRRHGGTGSCSSARQSAGAVGRASARAGQAS